MGTIPAAPAAPGSRGKRQDDSVRVRGLHLLWGGESTLPSVLTVTQGGAARVHAAPDGAWEEQRGWQVPPQVCCTAYDAASGRLAVGCEGAELRLYDAATGELAFTFKGGKPNMGAELAACCKLCRPFNPCQLLKQRHKCAASTDPHPTCPPSQSASWTSRGTQRWPSCRLRLAAQPAPAFWWARGTTKCGCTMQRPASGRRWSWRGARRASPA